MAIEIFKSIIRIGIVTVTYYTKYIYQLYDKTKQNRNTFVYIIFVCTHREAIKINVIIFFSFAEHIQETFFPFEFLRVLRPDINPMCFNHIKWKKNWFVHFFHLGHK